MEQVPFPVAESGGGALGVGVFPVRAVCLAGDTPLQKSRGGRQREHRCEPEVGEHETSWKTQRRIRRIQAGKVEESWPVAGKGLPSWGKRGKRGVWPRTIASSLN